MTEWLTAAEAAELVGIAPSTWRSYVARGSAPRPERSIGPLNLWRREAVEAWQRTRPGRGNWRKPKSGHIDPRDWFAHAVEPMVRHVEDQFTVALGEVTDDRDLYVAFGPSTTA